MADDDVLIELGSLRKTLTATGRRVDDQERVVADIAGRVEAIAETLGARDPDFALAPWWWPAMNREQAEQAWSDLTSWVDDVVIGRYEAPPDAVWHLGESPHSPRVLRCWFAHPGIVDKLSALHWSHKGSYRKGATPNAPLDWQEVWLPKTLTALGEEFRSKKCAGACPYLNQEPVERGPVTHDALGKRERKHWINADIEYRGG